MHRMITMHARSRRAERQTDRRTNIMALARRFVLIKATHAKKWYTLYLVTIIDDAESSKGVILTL